jgi:hypothetical protein
MGIRGTSVDMTGHGLDGRDSIPSTVKIFLFSAESRSSLGPNQIPIQWVSGKIFPGVKRPRPETDHSHSSSDEVKNGGATPLLPNTSSRHSAQLITHRDNFTLLNLGLITTTTSRVQSLTVAHMIKYSVFTWSPKVYSREEYFLLGYGTVYSGRNLLIFRSNVLHQFSELKSKSNKQAPSTKYPITVLRLSILCLNFYHEDGSSMLLRNPFNFY